KYGVLSDKNAYGFIVRGKAKVASVDTSTPVGMVALENPAFGQHAVTIYAGPLVFGTTLRDVLSFIDFNDFTNQMQYAGVAKSLNKKALAMAFKDVDLAGLADKSVRFLGVFSTAPDGTIKLVPISIEVLSS